MKKTADSWSHSLKFLLFSAVGIFMFFIPISVNGKSSIPLDHLVTWVRDTAGDAVPLYALLVILLGAIYPFYTKTWNRDKVTTTFSLLKVAGLIAAVLLYFEWGPSWLSDPNMGPFLFEKLVVPVGLLVPIGAVFLAFIVGYGLMEFIGVLVQKIMRPIWKTSGRSAVDAVASFVGSYSIGLLITNRVFKEGKYTVKEAAVIATGFSTVSATFMIVVANTLGLMEMWNTYFWSTLAVTFLVTAITVRIRPLSSMENTYATGEGKPEEVVNEKILQNAWDGAMRSSANAPAFFQNVWSNLKDGFVMAMSILPSIMSVGLIGLLLAEYTPVFDWIGYVFYPITWALQLPDAMLAAKAASIGIAEMFLPALLVAEAALVTKFVIGVVSVASILFFSASIPCVLSTEIPISLPKLVWIWFQRTVLALILATPLAYLLL
ncbi:YjiH family protein [Fictibacillus nanhaiensis]|uniref:YjiH family protein n=1 Tax=Fictibacillus nanhaiensis TaxID=742169 RepID=UPI001C9846D0|nr:YjiH family protein [Fictibacillus nanhaiensis]MBY6037295.1 YjiH family protein [Fictibacillus nanhaiensis]